MNGIGNDYVYVNGFEEHVDDPTGLAVRIADRHRGVGGDGLILILPDDEADVRMRMFNADGSESEMCGNGIRCVAKYAFDHGLTTGKPMRVATGAGILTIDYEVGPDGKMSTATVDMGAPILESAGIPARLSGFGDYDRIINVAFNEHFDIGEWRSALDQCGFDGRFTCVSMGNPHAVLYCRDVVALPLDRFGPILENHVAFPRRINIHVVQIHTRTKVTMRTWERGTGLTQACGTGASAVCVAGVLTAKNDRTILAHLPGGDLTLEWRESDNHVYKTGPATEVFSGDWPE